MPRQNKPGRPPGSSRLNAGDDLLLQRIADRMILAPAVKVTPAMVAVGITDETVHRRLRRKWKPVAARYLQEAHIRRDEAAAENRRETMRLMMQGLQRFADGLNAVHGNFVLAINQWAARNPDVIEAVRATTDRFKALESQMVQSRQR